MGRALHAQVSPHGRAGTQGRGQSEHTPRDAAHRPYPRVPGRNPSTQGVPGLPLSQYLLHLQVLPYRHLKGIYSMEAKRLRMLDLEDIRDSLKSLMWRCAGWRETGNTSKRLRTPWPSGGNTSW